MRVVWDPNKADSNLRKHGVDFADAAVALGDENALTIVDEDQPELRYKTLAMGPTLSVLFVVHAEIEDDLIRIISARKATKTESRIYFEGDFDGR